MKTTATIAGLFCLAATAAAANDYAPAMQSYLDENVSAWMNDPVLVEAIKAQNDAHSGLDAAKIEELDQAWRAEVGGSDTPTITPVLENAAAEFLRAKVAEGGGAITEIFVMDNHGLNVAASDVTSDYWQGDEAKFQKTYPMGAGTVFIDEVEFDESTQSFQGQVSVTIVDPASGEAIGAMTVGLNAEALM